MIRDNVRESVFEVLFNRERSKVTVEWDDCYYPQEVQVETDYGYISPGIAHMMTKECVYDEISRLSPKDQAVIHGYILGKPMKEIVREARLKSEQSARNKKFKIVVRLRNAINGQASQDACPSVFFLFPAFIIQKSYIFTHFGI